MSKTRKFDKDDWSNSNRQNNSNNDFMRRRREARQRKTRRWDSIDESDNTDVPPYTTDRYLKTKYHTY